MKRKQRYEEKRFQKLAELAGTGRILDIGFAQYPNKYLKGNVYGLDLFVDFHPPNYRQVIEGDATHLPFRSGTFDAIVAGEIIEHLENILLFFVEANRVLNYSGNLVVSCPNCYYFPEIVKNMLLLKTALFENTHIQLVNYRHLLKLSSLTGFHLQKLFGDYFRLPKFGIRIPLPHSPAFTYRNIFLFKKVENVSYMLLTERLRKINQQERRKAQTYWKNGETKNCNDFGQ